jgi:hypothetical protein
MGKSKLVLDTAQKNGALFIKVSFFLPPFFLSDSPNQIGKDVHSGEQMIDRFVKVFLNHYEDFLRVFHLTVILQGTGYFPSYGLSHQMGNLVDSLVPGKGNEYIATVYVDMFDRQQSVVFEPDN